MNRARSEGVDAVIASDQAAIFYARSIGLEVHISTQLNLSNIETVAFYAQYADVVVLARELSLAQVRAIADGIRSRDLRGPKGEPLRIEMFAHGALCMAVSGKCYLSLHESAHSANRGSCRQICRRAYTVRDRESGEELVVDNKYIMSPKDLCTVDFLDRFLDAGVRVLKIEGRARSADYVKRVVECYDEALRAIEEGTYTPERAEQWKERLRTVFNRGFWGGYYMGARAGEWSRTYGSSATVRKVYVGKVTNYFARIGVIELQVEAAPLSVGEPVFLTGETDRCRRVRRRGDPCGVETRAGGSAGRSLLDQGSDADPPGRQTLQNGSLRREGRQEQVSVKTTASGTATGKEKPAGQDQAQQCHISDPDRAGRRGLYAVARLRPGRFRRHFVHMAYRVLAADGRAVHVRPRSGLYDPHTRAERGQPELAAGFSRHHAVGVHVGHYAFGRRRDERRDPVRPQGGDQRRTKFGHRHADVVSRRGLFHRDVSAAHVDRRPGGAFRCHRSRHAGTDEHRTGRVLSEAGLRAGSFLRPVRQSSRVEMVDSENIPDTLSPEMVSCGGSDRQRHHPFVP